MYVLVACEESQEVCKAFRERGHDAFSCDLQECSGEHPEWHIKTDVMNVLYGHTLVFTQSGDIYYIMNWDLIIAHPPCTYLSAAGACRMYLTKGVIDDARYEKAMRAKDFFMKLTYLWLRGLPELKPTKVLEEYKPYVSCGTSRNKGNPDKSGASRAGGAQKVRSKTFSGIAKAMAEQWGVK